MPMRDDIVVAEAIDNDSLAKDRLVAMPRAVFAEFLQKISEVKPKAIALDVTLQTLLAMEMLMTRNLNGRSR